MWNHFAARGNFPSLRFLDRISGVGRCARKPKHTATLAKQRTVNRETATAISVAVDHTDVTLQTACVSTSHVQVRHSCDGLKATVGRHGRARIFNTFSKISLVFNKCTDSEVGDFLFRVKIRDGC